MNLKKTGRRENELIQSLIKRIFCIGGDIFFT